MVGTRGVPAQYGGFETAVEEIGRRLVERGHQVTVYCRSGEADDLPTHLGMERVELPAIRRKSLETLSHTLLSAIDVWRRPRYDAIFLFNCANALSLPLLRRRRTRVAVHVDGIESRRAKWGRVGHRYYRLAEALSARWADALIADSWWIGNYYSDEFGATTEMIAYGAPVLDSLDDRQLGEYGLEPGRYHLVVARFEPENNVDMIVRGYSRSGATLPLIIVGGAPYARGYIAGIHEDAASDHRVRMIGPVWDQETLGRLYHHAATYVHGHSVGGTNPSLLRAMGSGTAVVAYDVVFAREVAGDAARYFVDEASLARLIEDAEADPAGTRARGTRGKNRVKSEYRWDDVARRYEDLARRLAEGASRRREVSGRRNPRSAWRNGRIPSTACSDPATVTPTDGLP